MRTKNIQKPNKPSEADLKKLIKQLMTLEPLRDYSDSYWSFYIPVTINRWEKLSITLYNKNYYFLFAGSNFEMCYPEKKKEIEWDHPELKWIVFEVPKIIKEIQKDLGVYYRQLHQKLPTKYRWGLVPRKAVNIHVHDIMRPDLDLGSRSTDKIVRWIEKNQHNKFKIDKPMTLNIYLKYCKVAYMANAKKLGITENKSGMELYKRYADNRHEGLLDIDPNSSEAFNKWYSGSRFGGHPWEIYRGGNTTHISLGIHKVDDWRLDKDSKTPEYEIFLNGLSTVRLVETARIALAFIEEGMPFTFSNADEVRKKLLGLDNIGIVPEWYSTHRANQSFVTGLDVHDCLQLHDLTPQEKKLLKPYFSWLPLSVILPSAGKPKKYRKKK